MLKTKKAKIKNMGRLQDSNPAHLDSKPSLYRLRYHHGPAQHAYLIITALI